MANNDDVITTKLLFEASKALRTLLDLAEGASTLEAKINLAKAAVKSFAEENKISFDKAKKALSALDAEFSEIDNSLNQTSTTSTVFGDAGAKAWNKVGVAAEKSGNTQKRVMAEIDALKQPTIQNRGANGRFEPKAPGFSQQFTSLSTYQEKLKLVQDTMENIGKKTNAPYKDIGKELGKSFPELLNNTNLVAAAVDNLTNKNMGLSSSFKPVKQTATEVGIALTKLQDAGKLNITGNAKTDITALKNAFTSIKGSTGASFDQIADGMRKMGIEAKLVKTALKGVNDELSQGEDKTSLFAKAWNIALGMLIHQGINMVVNALQNMFKMAISGLRELEIATYNLINAEEKLSGMGVEITPKDMDSYIKKLQELNPMLSKIQATELVSTVSAKVAPNVGMGKEGIESLTQSIAILAVRNKGLGKSFEEVESQIVNAFLSGKVSVGINQLGVKISDQIVKEKALAMGLVKTADAYEKLNAAEEVRINGLAMVQILEENTNAERSHLPEYFKSADAKFGIFQARMQDFFTSIGKVMGPGIKVVLDYLITGFEKASAWVDKNKDSLALFGEVAGEALVITMKLVGAVLKFGEAGGLAFGGAISGLQKMIDKSTYLKKLLGMDDIGIAGADDTPTTGSQAGGASPVSPYGAGYAEAVKKTEEQVTSIMKDAHEKQEDMARDHANKLADLARDYGRKLVDIAVNLRDKIADAQRDNADKVVEINSDIDKKIAEAKQETYKKSVEAEKKYQDELKNLREKYMMDLEDALRARDARQVLKLMQQYAIDKNKAAENRDKEQEEARAATAEKLRDLERERKEKLIAAAKDLADKIKQAQLAAAIERRDAATAHRRALEDARLAYQRQLAEQRLFLQRKLQDLLASIAKEYELTAAGRAAINALVGSGGSTATANFAPYGSASSTWAASPNFAPYGGGMAEGGTFLATRPATISVGENRPEMITATPLGKPGKDIGKLFSNGSFGGGGDGGGGKIELGLTLSPDLEARIISQTLSETANVVLKINRSKS